MYYYYPSSRGETERMHWDRKEGKAREVGATVAVKAEWSFLFELVVPAESQRVGTTVLLYCHGDLLHSREREREESQGEDSGSHNTTHKLYSCILQHQLPLLLLLHGCF